LSYTGNIPLSGQSLGVTKNPINSNFTTLQTVFDVNHVDYNNLGAGKHFFLEMPVGVDMTTIANEGGLYTKDVGSAPAYACLFYRQESGGADPLRDQGAVIQMTSIKPLIAANGYTFLPGGMLLQWGTVASTGTNPTITFPIAFSSTPYSVQFNPARSGMSSVSSTFYLNTSVLSATQFQIVNSSAGTTNYSYYWSAIGAFTT
jgi:hypothetical protein